MANETEFGQLTIDVKFQKEIANHLIFISDCQGSLPVIKKDYQREWIKCPPLLLLLGVGVPAVIPKHSDC